MPYTQLVNLRTVSEAEILYINVQWFRGGLVFKAHRRLYHSTLGSRVIKKMVPFPISDLMSGRVELEEWLQLLALILSTKGRKNPPIYLRSPTDGP